MRKVCICLILIVFCQVFTEMNGQNLEGTVDSIFSKYETKPGYVVAIYSGNKIIFKKGYGVANLDYDIPLTPSSVFDIGSISKQFTAACILLLEEQGKVDIEDPIHKHLPDFPKYNQGIITIRDLLYHTSGLNDYLSFLRISGKTYNDHFTEAMAMDILSKIPFLSFPPGSQYEYSNSNYLVLAAIIRQVSNVSIGAFAAKYIFQPLKMNNTFILEDPLRVVKNRAIGYYKDEDDGGIYKRDHFFDFALGGDGQLYTTVEDFFLWHTNFQDQKVLGENIVNRLLKKGSLLDGSFTEEGLGVASEKYKGKPAFGYEGWFAGTVSKYLNIPSENVGVILISNGNDFDLEAFYKVVELATPNLIEPKIEDQKNENNETITSIFLTSEKLNSYKGTYWNYKESLSRKIYVQSDTLRFQEDNAKLIPVGQDEFLLQNGQNRTKVIWQTKEDGSSIIRLILEDNVVKEYIQYEKVSYSKETLSKLTGIYDNADLNTRLKVVIEDKKLVIYINAYKYTDLEPIMSSLFLSENYGIFIFNHEDKGTSFEYLGLEFKKID